jgi:hypothetical protein
MVSKKFPPSLEGAMRRDNLAYIQMVIGFQRFARNGEAAFLESRVGEARPCSVGLHVTMPNPLLSLTKKAGSLTVTG